MALGARPRDVVVLVVTLLTAGVAALASYFPARRATRVNHTSAIREG